MYRRYAHDFAGLHSPVVLFADEMLANDLLCIGGGVESEDLAIIANKEARHVVATARACLAEWVLRQG